MLLIVASETAAVSPRNTAVPNSARSAATPDMQGYCCYPALQHPLCPSATYHTKHSDLRALRRHAGMPYAVFSNGTLFSTLASGTANAACAVPAATRLDV